MVSFKDNPADIDLRISLKKNSNISESEVIDLFALLENVFYKLGYKKIKCEIGILSPYELNFAYNTVIFLTGILVCGNGGYK